MRLRTALALSRNACTVGLLEKIGLEKAINFARKAGITSPISHDYTTALGSSAVTPLELTSAYATFASQAYTNRSSSRVSSTAAAAGRNAGPSLEAIDRPRFSAGVPRVV
jgi:membrane peptidoglycan carboxypeptidase